MGSGHCEEYKVQVTIQSNGIIRDPFGWVVGRCDDDWLALMIWHTPAGLRMSPDGDCIMFQGERYRKVEE